MSEILDILEKTFLFFNKQGIKYCLLSSKKEFLKVLCGEKDIDIFVENIQYDLCQKILINLKLKRIENIIKGYCKSLESWIAFDESTGKLIRINIYYKLIIDRDLVIPNYIQWSKLIVSNAYYNKKYNIKIMNDNLSVILELIKNTLNSPLVISKERISKILEKYNVNSGELNILLNSLFIKEDIKETVVKIVINKDFSNKLRLILKLSLNKEFSYYQIRFKDIIKLSICKLNRDKYNKQQYNKLINRGSIIALIGCDGVGKSTISNNISYWFAEQIDAQRVFLGSGDGPHEFIIRVRKKINIFRNRRRNSIQNNSNKVNTRLNNTNERKSKFKRLVSAFFYYAQAKERYSRLVKANKDRMMGSILITDRYPQSQFFGLYDGPAIEIKKNDYRLTKAFAKKEKNIYKLMDELPPNIIIKMYIPLEVAKKRKPEDNFKSIEEKAKLTSIIKYPYSKIIHLDASLPYNDVLWMIKKQIWEYI